MCDQPFSDVGGPAMREVHHIIPVAYGGVNGPTVDLCDTHHSALHKIALAVRHRKPHAHLLVQAPTAVAKQRLLWLASRVNVAWAATHKDPNKKLEVSIIVDATTKTELQELARLFPQVRGRAALIKHVIHLYHRSRFLR